MRKRNKEQEAARQRIYNKTPKRKKYIRKWKEENRERINELARKRYTTDGRWEKQLRDRFGLEPEQYWKMHEEQKGLCAICEKPQCVGTKLDVDHDHETGKVRALLCRHCNTGIGLLGDSTKRTLIAYWYLRFYKNAASTFKAFNEVVDILRSAWKRT